VVGALVTALLGPGAGAALAASRSAASATPTPAASSSAASSSSASSSAVTTPGPVVLLGTGGLRWSDVDENTPALTSFQNSGSIGWLAARSVRTSTCPVDGWLAVSAGARAADAPRGPSVAKRTYTCAEPADTISSSGGSATVTDWATYAREAKDGNYEAVPGLLGDTLARVGTRVAAVGPGAALALAGERGVAAHVWPGKVSDAHDAAVDPTALSTDVASALKTDPQLLVVDLGDIRDPGKQAKGEPKPAGEYAQPRADQVQDLDTRLGLVLGDLPPNATVILASLADSGVSPQLQLVAASGPAPLGGTFATSLLGSRSTRQNGLIQATDLMPTLLATLHVSTPAGAVGTPLEPVKKGGTAQSRLRKVTDLDRASTAVHPIVPIFFESLIAAQIVLYGLATLVLRRSSRDDNPAAAKNRRRSLRGLRRMAVIFACVPAATFLANLVPWWRASYTGWTVTALVAAFTVPLALIATLGPWRNALLGPMGAVGGMTAAILGIDVCTGSHLQLSSLMGLQPLVAGRFYGFGNPSFALFATGLLLLALAVADWLIGRGETRRAVVAVLAIGFIGLVVDGTPGLGSDFGGPPALIPAFAVLALLLAGVKITWRRVLLIVGVTVTVLVVLAVADWLRPADDRTHLGRFVQTVIDGGAWPVIKRKGQQNLRILFTSWLSAMLPFAVAFVVLVLARPVAWGARPLQLAYDRSRTLKPGLIAFGVLVLLGFLLNDSGSAVPAVAATIALPALIAASVRALELSDSARLDAAIAAVRRATKVRR
jgi:hypothetical protein